MEKKRRKRKTYKYKCDVRRRRRHLSKPNNTWLLESIEGYTRVGKVSDKENENENENEEGEARDHDKTKTGEAGDVTGGSLMG